MSADGGATPCGGSGVAGDWEPGMRVTIDGYIPRVIGEVIATHADEAWVRWPNGTSVIVSVHALRLDTWGLNP